MSRVAQVYLSEEADLALQKKRQEDPSFNLSGLISEILIGSSNSNPLDTEKVQIEIEKKKSSKEALTKEIEILEKKYLNMAIEKEKREKELQEKSAKEVEKKKYLFSLWKSNAMEFFENINEIQAENLADEYYKIKDITTQTWYDFLVSQGFKEKPLQEAKQ